MGVNPGGGSGRDSKTLQKAESTWAAYNTKRVFISWVSCIKDIPSIMACTIVRITYNLLGHGAFDTRLD